MSAQLKTENVNLNQAGNDANTVTTVDQLAYALEIAKAKKAEAESEVHTAEDALIAAIGFKPEGAFSIQGDYYKVTTTGKLDRKVDQDRVIEIRESIKNIAIATKIFKAKYELSTTLYKSLKDANPELYAKISEIVTTKPAKTAVAIERLEVK